VPCILVSVFSFISKAMLKVFSFSLILLFLISPHGKIFQT